MGRRLPLRPRRSGVAVAATLALAAGLVGVASSAPASANVAVNEVYTIPTSGANAGKFTIQWRGNGHGHGLSQFGAKGAAEQGLTYPKILDFYYPGTKGATTNGTIRVKLSGLPADKIVVKPTGTLQVIDTDNPSVAITLPLQVTRQGVAVTPTRWRLVVGENGRTIVAYYDDVKWTLYKKLVGDGEFLDSALGYVTVLKPTTKRYRGILLAKSLPTSTMHRYPVNIVDLEDYVAGVLPMEMSPSWPKAAVRAQAIAARTYAVFERAAYATTNYYDICDTTACQVYGGMDAENALATSLIKATAGKYREYQGKPAFTQFSSSNGGWTSYGGQPYLPLKADPYTPSSEEVYGRTYSWSKDNIATTPLTARYPAIGTVRSIAITTREGGTGAPLNGRVISMKITGSTGSQVISGDTFAAIFGLTSNWFTLQVTAPSSGGSPTTPPSGTTDDDAPMNWQDNDGGDTAPPPTDPAQVSGLDVSSHTVLPKGKDWVGYWQDRVTEGYKFAFIKATEGTYYDPTSSGAKFNGQYQGATAVGMLRGAYHFANPNPKQTAGKAGAAAQAQYFVNNGGGWSPDGKTLPGVLDIEYNPYGSNTCYGLTQAQMVAWVKAFSKKYLALTGVYPTIYTTVDWWTRCTGNSKAFAKTNPFWIADPSSTIGQPRSLPMGTKTWTYWQHGSDPGVDWNKFNGKMKQLTKLAKTPAYQVGSHVKAAWTPSMGQPIGPEKTVVGLKKKVGYVQKFPRGVKIFASKKWGAFAMSGAILKKYTQIGGPTKFGWPTKAMKLRKAFGVQGWVQRFQGGKALMSSPYGTFRSNRYILKSWRLAKRGWPRSGPKSRMLHGKAVRLQKFHKAKNVVNYGYNLKNKPKVHWVKGNP